MSAMITTALFLPLLSAIALLLLRPARFMAGAIASVSVAASFLLFCTAALVSSSDWPESGYRIHFYDWIAWSNLTIGFDLTVDHLSLLMAFIITGIGALIHLYSCGYMEEDADYVRYFAFLNFFIFAMLLLVLAGNLVLLFIGWEGVGLASYLLIGFWYTKPSAAKAAYKAFIINRIGDTGLVLAVLFALLLFGNTNITTILEKAQSSQGHTLILTLITLCLFLAAVGKSAQLPLQSWLPDAMEGPTPVSALIHAATMVTAGVYLIVRMHDLFLLTPFTLEVIGTIGASTALFAALCACGQTDLKRILAYSTISQLGFMFLACGAGAFYFAMFHLTSHAFVKALLFLTAGNVIHAVHGITEMDKMGRLSRKMPLTQILFLAGALALSGIPPFAPFFSKDYILENEHVLGWDILYWTSLIAAILTAFYMTRAYIHTFHGQPDPQQPKLHLPGTNMLIPVSLLGVLSLIGGALGYAFGNTPVLEEYLLPIGITPTELDLTHGPLLSKDVITALAGSLAGIFIATLICFSPKMQKRQPWMLAKKAFYIEDIYNILLSPLKGIAYAIHGFLEPRIFRGSITGMSHLAIGIAWGLQRFQSGLIRSYVAWMMIGLAICIFYLVI